MTQRNDLTTQPVHSVSLAKLMSLGAGIALILIAFFLFQVNNPDPAWGKLWMLKPLIVVPLAGAAGGAFFYFMDQLRYAGGLRKILANIISLIAFVFILWIGTVLGLNGTLWN